MIDLLKERDYAWSYFQLHANQRMTTFNFFLILAALMTTGLVGAIKPDFQPRYVGGALGLALIVVSFVFWKLDGRVRFLIQHSEAILKAIERELLAKAAQESPVSASLFSTEEARTAEIENTWKFWNWHLSYSKCFRVIYLVFALLGLVGAVASTLVA